MNTPDMRERVVQDGAEATTDTPDGFARYIRQDIDKWSTLIKSARIRATD